MKKIVIIPTYNEKENVQPLVSEIFKEVQDIDILFVDDGSPDGTALEVKKVQAQEFGNKVHLLGRTSKDGLGRAYIAGFKWALEKGYEAFIQMDADFSHRPVDLAKLAKAIETHHSVVGSRYIDGGGVKNWSWIRRLISIGGSIYTRFILSSRLHDWTGGFNAWQKSTLEGIKLDSVSSQGYSFQIELKYRAIKKGFNVVEEPILFEERRVGQSKMSSRIFIEAMYRVFLLRFNI